MHIYRNGILALLMAPALLSVSSLRARAADSVPLKISVERKDKLPWIWRSFPISIRIENISKKPITIRTPRIAIGPGEHWTTIDFLVERDGTQMRPRNTCAYEAQYGYPALTLKPGESTPPFEFDIQKPGDGLGSCVYWSLVDANEKEGKILSEFLGWGRYKVRIKYFNGVPPMVPQKPKDKAWIGEVISEPIEFTVL